MKNYESLTKIQTPKEIMKLNKSFQNEDIYEKNK